MTASEAPSPLDSSGWEWSDEISEADLKQLAATTLELYSRPERWIHRRVERIKFIDRETARREISVDFTLPTGLPPVAEFDEQPVYAAPLFLLPREHPRPLREGPINHWWTFWRSSTKRRVPQSLFSDVAFVDRDGRSQPLATRRQCQRLASAMLQQKAAEALGENLDDALRRDIAKLALGQVEEREKVLRRLLVKKVNKVAGGPTDLGSSAFAELAGLIAKHLPIICLCTTVAPGRSIVYLSYTEPIEIHRSPIRTRFWRLVGLRSERLTAEVSELGGSESNHIEVLVPEDLQVNYVALRGKRYSHADLDWDDLPVALAEPNICQVGASGSGNVHLSGLPYDRRVGHVLVGLRVHTTKFLTGAFFVSLFTTMTLFLLSQLAPYILRSDVSETQVAGLLILPSIVAAYIVRPGEHVLTSRMLRAARYFLVGNTTLAVLGALAFATTPGTNADPESAGVNLGGLITGILEKFSSQDSPAHGLAARWGLLAILSAGITVGFFINLWLPRPWGNTYYNLVPKEEVE